MEAAATGNAVAMAVAVFMPNTTEGPGRQDFRTPSSGWVGMLVPKLSQSCPTEATSPPGQPRCAAPLPTQWNDGVYP